ncbi:MAG: hypothetical protein JXN64_12440 [Spirochaetes bacterium]|nr:hypothetical protein [Spirochaetota bacterium]
MLVFFFNSGYALDEESKEPDRQYQHYEDIKRKQNRDYKKGVYKDEKKDYVNKWISEDINYQKRVIKLKSDYVAWANERQAAGKEIIFREYEPLKNFTAAEKEILWEYHNRFYKTKGKEKKGADKIVEVKKLKKIKTKKTAGQKITRSRESEFDKKIAPPSKIDEKDISADITGMNDAAGAGSGNNIYIYMIVGFALILIIVECLYLVAKRFQ